MAAITTEEFKRLAVDHLPFMDLMNVEAEAIEKEYAVLRANCDEKSLRPGGTVAGPVMMGLADAAFYAIVLANIGMVSLAVTTNLTINFLRKPGPGDVYCRATLLKLGKRLAVCEGLIYTKELGIDEPVAHVTGTYSIPPSN
ncbi:MAG: PaaI family thioesterase [Arenicellales bacterium]